MFHCWINESAGLSNQLSFVLQLSDKSHWIKRGLVLRRNVDRSEPQGDWSPIDFPFGSQELSYFKRKLNN